MAVFSIFHLWAFPWKVYDIRRSQIVISETAPGYLPDPTTAYKGGRLGLNALADAFNPWDLVKAIGRGFKWLAVGRRAREQDISYKNSTQGTGLEPVRSTFPSRSSAPLESDDFSADPGDDTHPYAGRKPARYRPLSEDEEDNLLSHAQSIPQSGPHSNSEQPYAPYSAHSTIDIGNTDRRKGNPEHSHTSKLPPAGPFEHHIDHGPSQESGTLNPTLDSQDTGYHGARLTPAIPTTSQRRDSLTKRPEDDWDAWGDGSHRDRETDVDGNGEVDHSGRSTTDRNRF